MKSHLLVVTSKPWKSVSVNEYLSPLGYDLSQLERDHVRSTALYKFSFGFDKIKW
jgi:hypothetical protein